MRDTKCIALPCFFPHYTLLCRNCLKTILLYGDRFFVSLVANMSSKLLKQFVGASMEPTLMLVTELMKGGTLQKFLWSTRPQCPDLKLSLSFALGISRAMEYLHAIGIIHRDLKPSNALPIL